MCSLNEVWKSEECNRVDVGGQTTTPGDSRGALRCDALTSCLPGTNSTMVTGTACVPAIPVQCEGSRHRRSWGPGTAIAAKLRRRDGRPTLIRRWYRRRSRRRGGWSTRMRVARLGVTRLLAKGFYRNCRRWSTCGVRRRMNELPAMGTLTTQAQDSLHEDLSPRRTLPRRHWLR